MRIFHRLSIDKDFESRFRKVGIDLSQYEDGTTKYGSFVIVRIDEADERWPGVSALIDSCDVHEIIESEFSSEELQKAKHLAFRSKWFSGFPQPEANMAYLEATFDLADYCAECGLGLRQKAPFQLLDEPKWGRRTTRQIHWVFDEIFVSADIWSEVFRRFDIGFWPVLQAGSGRELASIVQLKIDHVSDLELPDALPKKLCKKCKRIKYLPLVEGFYPKLSSGDGAIFKSKQYFGDGHAGDREMFVAHDLYLEMSKKKLNCNYWPCKQ